MMTFLAFIFAKILFLVAFRKEIRWLYEVLRDYAFKPAAEAYRMQREASRMKEEAAKAAKVKRLPSPTPVSEGEKA